MSLVSRRGRRALCLSLFASMAWAHGARAQTALPEITVSGASLVPIEAGRVGSSITVVTDAMIRDQGAKTVPDVLRLVPGVAVNQSGGRGALTQIRMRGAEANHTLVVVDGVPINDVNNGDADLANLPVDAIERIEVIRGPQSGVWGPNAQAGVVNIVTKSGRGLAKPEMTARVEGGSFGTIEGSASVRGSQGPFYGALSVTGAQSGGYVVAPGTSRPNGSDMGSLTARFGVDPNEWINIDGSLRLVRRGNVNNPANYAFGPNFAADPRYGFLSDGRGKSDADDVQGRIAATFRMLDGRWTHRFAVDTSRQDVNSASSYVSSFGVQERFSSWTKTERTRADYRTAFTFDTPGFLDARHTLVGGGDIARERWRYFYESDGYFGPNVNSDYTNGRSRERRGVFGEYLVSLNTGLSLSAVARHDWNSGFADATTWRATVNQRFETGTRLHASVGKAFTNPTFFDQFGSSSSFTGNANLRPEQSVGYDVGIEQTWPGGRLVTDVTYFRANLRDEIVYQSLSNGRYTMINLPIETHRQGVEVTTTLRPIDWLDVRASYTYTDARSAEDSGGGYVYKESLRRPKHAASLSATARFADNRGRITLSVAHNGSMRDRYFGVTASDVTLKSYTLVGLNISYDIRKNVTAYLRGENLLGQRYQEVYGYDAPGPAIYGGLRVRLGDE